MSPRTVKSSGQGQILVVDDNEFNVEIVGMLIERHSRCSWRGAFRG